MMTALYVVIILFLLTPSAFAAPLGSWPLTPAGCALLATAIGGGVLSYRLRATWSRVAVALVACVVVLIAARWTLALSVQDTGWRGAYFANDAWSGQPEWSSDFRFTDATRIDPALRFAAGELPVFYLNDYRFTEGDPRDVSQPLSAEWRGAFQLSGPDTVNVDVDANGAAALEIDGREILATSSTAQARLSLDAGPHRVQVRYRKAAGENATLRVSLSDANGELKIVPPGSEPRDQRGLIQAASFVDWLAMLVLVVAVFRTLQSVWRSESRADYGGATALVTAFGIQGYVTALASIRFRTLSGGDDWFGFESRARDILHHGLLMPLGHAIGQGDPYFYHPFYSYFLAAIHALTGESLFGPVFTQFLILAATALVAGGLVRRSFGTVASVAATVAVVLLFEIDFVRYYTTTLLSENLYVLTVTCCLAAFARWAMTGRTRSLVVSGMFGGLSSVTRPAMLVFFIPAVLVAAILARRRHLGLQWPMAAVVVAVAWLAVVMPFTARNWIVSRQAVLVSSGQQRTVVALNVPFKIDPAPYVAMVESGATGTAGALWRVAMDYPGRFISFQVYKLGFTLGMVHWFEPYPVHPELLAMSALYFSMLVFSVKMRSAELWPVHAFIATHWASMALTSPWNYGYRLILPPFVYTTALSVAAASTLVRKGHAIRS